MKKRLLSIAFVAAMAVTAGLNFAQSENKVNLSDLAMANVEALAQSEDGEVKCRLTDDYWQWCYPWGTDLGCSPCFS